MTIKFKNGDKVKFPSQINGDIGEVLECINLQEYKNSSSEDKFTLRIIPRYRCKTIDYNGAEIINNISENLIEQAN